MEESQLGIWAIKSSKKRGTIKKKYYKFYKFA